MPGLAPTTDEIDVTLADALHDLGEHFAAGYLELPNDRVVSRMARGLRRQLENTALPEWRGESLYPSGPFSWCHQGATVTFHYSHSMCVDRRTLATLAGSDDPRAQRAYGTLSDALGDYYQVGEDIDPDVGLGGRNYTHSILNYGRILRQGLCEYEGRVAGHLEEAQARRDSERISFYTAMYDVLEGLRAAHARCLAYLRVVDPKDAAERKSLTRLIRSLEHVPWQPARTFYEALVGTNLLFYLDGTDNLGRFDRDLGDLFERDLESGELTFEEGVQLVGQIWDNMDANIGWNVAIGGTNPDGTSASNRLTLACLRAARGRRRPNLALCLPEDESSDIWDAALDSISSGCGIPALYNDAAYLEAIGDAGLNVAPQDLHRHAFGGCTELMVHGCSNVGSLDAGLNLPLILTRTLALCLPSAPDFGAVLACFIADMRGTVRRLVAQVNAAQEHHARFQPQPLRTLLIDDCLDAGREFNDGGARYNWSVINVGGLANVVDSLAAVRELVFDARQVSGAELLAALEANYSGHEALRQRASACPRYGNDDPKADRLARDVATEVFCELGRHTPWRGGKFLPACLMFVTYAGAGESVMATPDGRLDGVAIADSIGPVQGRDRRGPSAMIRSVASLPQHLAPGTLVTNFRFARSMFEGKGRDRMVDLIKTYFRLGGMQAQITVVDQDVLRDAVLHPDRHGDLIVRIGGYSEYWRNLSQALRESVLARTEYAL